MDTSESSTSRTSYGERGGSTQFAEDAKDFAGRAADRGSQVYGQTKETLSKAYDRTGEALNETYEWMMSYGREHPGRTMLIAFGAGAGLGFLLASNQRSSSRSSAYIEPVVNAISQLASDMFRRR